MRLRLDKMELDLAFKDQSHKENEQEQQLDSARLRNKIEDLTSKLHHRESELGHVSNDFEEAAQ